jgi:hypothetical protein
MGDEENRPADLMNSCWQILPALGTLIRANLR